jgi:protein gp37
MGAETDIGWTDHTFNPWIGCSRVSPACAACYAAAWARQRRGLERGTELWKRHGPRQVTTPSYWRQALKWDAEAAAGLTGPKVFAASLADVFEDHPDLDEPRSWLFDLIGQTPNLTWQLLTKRIENVASMVPWATWPGNVWLGTSVESQPYADARPGILASIPALVRFLSVEPLTEPVLLPLDGIHWVILGGLSGARYKRHVLQAAWARSVRDQCADAGAAFFFKQWGGLHAKDGGKELDGREWCDFPVPPPSWS